ncbi:MAG: HD-GYP domain-containing protein, partial [Lachnospiraceae bacterium]|nr:HD-GYP domain-containing protein [Lachnospiraceae bacterium]
MMDYRNMLIEIFIVLAVALMIFLVMLIIMVVQKRNYAVQQRKQKILIDEMIYAFAKCIDMKDNYTKGHSFRVAKYTQMLTQKLGYPREIVDDYYNIALLHDIGKISVPDAILNKQEGLTDEEYEIMKSHAAAGYEVLKDITVAPDLALGAGFHHERMDGKGYPKGLKGNDIPRVAQIIAVADTFDAMYSNRPYRKKLELSEVTQEMKRISG